jgi:hypothetical protein
MATSWRCRMTLDPRETLRARMTPGRAAIRTVHIGR